MKKKYGLFSLLSRLGKHPLASSPGLLARLLRDEAGMYLIYMTLITPVLIGVAALGTEGGLRLYQHQNLQGAADAAAYSAAVAAYIRNETSAQYTTEAEAIVGQYTGSTVTHLQPIILHTAVCLCDRTIFECNRSRRQPAANSVLFKLLVFEHTTRRDQRCCDHQQNRWGLRADDQSDRPESHTGLGIGPYYCERMRSL